MLFRREFLRGIREGHVKLAFRRWQRPTVKAGGTLMTAVGQLHIAAVAKISISSITSGDARAAGFESKKALLADLNERDVGDIYRIEFGALEIDPRIALRSQKPTAAELGELQDKLTRMDARSEHSWTGQVLAILKANEGMRAGDLCEQVGQERVAFKRNVRKLKNLGLTESLGTGYRLSPRGLAVLRRMKKHK